jgi:hypothetical protein
MTICFIRREKDKDRFSFKNYKISHMACLNYVICRFPILIVKMLCSLQKSRDYTSIMLDIIHCLIYILYTRHFRSWFYSHLQETTCHFTDRLFFYFLNFNVSGSSWDRTWDVLNIRWVQKSLGHYSFVVTMG